MTTPDHDIRASLGLTGRSVPDDAARQVDNAGDYPIPYRQPARATRWKGDEYAAQAARLQSLSEPDRSVWPMAFEPTHGLSAYDLATHRQAEHDDNYRKAVAEYAIEDRAIARIFYGLIGYALGLVSVPALRAMGLL